MTAAEVRRWLAAGAVRRVLRGVYCPSDLPDELETRAVCAALVLPSHAVVCDRSAAWLWGIDVHDPDERCTIPDLEVVSLRGNARVERAGVLPGTRDLAPADIVEVGGVRVTTPLRTALDLACLRGRSRALATLDAFRRECGLTREDFHRLLPRYAGRRGVTQARALVPLAIATSESPGESWTRLAIVDEGLPAPEPQWEVWEGGRLIYRLDLAYAHLRICVEYDGEEFHGAEHADADGRRRQWLKDRGWHVIVVRKHQLRGAAREAWLRDLRAALAERAARRKRVYARRPEPWVHR